MARLLTLYRSNSNGSCSGEASPLLYNIILLRSFLSCFSLSSYSDSRALYNLNSSFVLRRDGIGEGSTPVSTFFTRMRSSLSTRNLEPLIVALRDSRVCNYSVEILPSSLAVYLASVASSIPLYSSSSSSPISCSVTTT